MPGKRDRLIAQFAAGQRKRRITEDDPRWNPATMGNKRGTRPLGPSKTRITEDDPRWNPATMGNKRWGRGYRGALNYSKGSGRPELMPAVSQKQRAWAFGNKGEAWARKHHFDTPGRLPATAKGGRRRKQMIAQFARKHRHG